MPETPVSFCHFGTFCGNAHSFFTWKSFRQSSSTSAWNVSRNDSMAFVSGPTLFQRFRIDKPQSTHCNKRPAFYMMASAEKSRSVIVVSSINADSTYTLDALPLRGETVLSNSLTQTLGGKGANTSVACARAGASTYFIGAVGTNATFLAKLHDYGVNISHCIQDNSTETGHAIILLEKAGENSIVVHPGANALVTEKAIDPLQSKLPQSVVALHLEIPHEVVQSVAVRASEAGATVVLNPSPVPLAGSPLADPGAALWRSVDVLIVNAVELGLLAGCAAPSFDDVPNGEPLPEKHVHSLARMLGELRSKVCIRHSAVVVVTLGSHGVVYQNAGVGRDCSESGTLQQVAALGDIEVVDSTGAGDCLTGYISACLAAGLDFESTVRHAVVAAGLCVTKSGTAHAIPEMSAVKERLFATR